MIGAGTFAKNDHITHQISALFRTGCSNKYYVWTLLYKTDLQNWQCPRSKLEVYIYKRLLSFPKVITIEVFSVLGIFKIWPDLYYFKHSSTTYNQGEPL